MIKNYFIRNMALVTIVVVITGMISCQKKLNQIPQTSITDANFWKTASDLELACNYLYSYLPGLTGEGPYIDRYSEIAFNARGGANSISDGSRLAPASSSDWNDNYRLIRACNNILERSATVTGDAEMIAQYKGEAHFFRALAYYNLVKRFGDVPYIGKTLTLEDSLLYSSRVNREVVVDSIYADLDYAAAHCPSLSEQASSDYGRITSAAALAFKSRVALFEGTWDKFHQQGDYAKHLKTALSACNAIMNSGECNLFTYSPDPDSSYYYLFHYQDASTRTNWTYANNHEVILPHLYGVSLDNVVTSHSFERGGATDGDVTGTKNLIDYYLYKDGLPNGKSPYDSTLQETSSLTVFRNRDPRFGMTYFKRNETYPSITGYVPYTPGLEYNIKKYNNISDFSQSTSFQSFWVIRYAEVLLNFAEATYELNESISDADLNKSINLLRARVNMPSLTNAFVNSNGLDMRTEIRRERTIELSFEGFHYWDILRWKTAEDILPQALLGQKYFPDEMTVPEPSLNPDGYAILEPASKRSFNPQRDYLWPLPTQQLALNPQLTQNPDWQ